MVGRVGEDPLERPGPNSMIRGEKRYWRKGIPATHPHVHMFPRSHAQTPEEGDKRTTFGLFREISFAVRLCAGKQMRFGPLALGKCAWLAQSAALRSKLLEDSGSRKLQAEVGIFLQAPAKYTVMWKSGGRSAPGRERGELQAFSTQIQHVMQEVKAHWMLLPSSHQATLKPPKPHPTATLN